MRKLPSNGTRGKSWSASRRFRGWLATWLQDRRRGRLLPAPVLVPLWPSLLQWDWDLPNPYKWNVWLTLDGGATFFMPEDYWAYGAARQFAPDGGSQLHFIVGVDANGREITHRSNAVRPDDAIAPPAAPSNLVLTPGEAFLHLDWQDNSSNEAGFRIYRRAYSDPFALLVALPANSVAYTDWTPELGVPYTYYVVAYNGAGESEATAQVGGFPGGGLINHESPPSYLECRAVVAESLWLRGGSTPRQRP